MGMHIDRIYKSRLQAMVSVVQQWLSPNGKTKDLIGAVHEIGWLNCASPREVLDSCLSSIYIGLPKKKVLIPMKNISAREREPYERE